MNRQHFPSCESIASVNGTFALVALATTVCAAGLAESWWYRRQLSKIPHRIHINGTRGKSSVARLIAAGLRAGGIRTCAKTTGTLARMIFSDGHELPIFRPDRANIIEQKRIIRTAVADRAEALVIECMALQPLLQSVCELKLVRSTIGVITNARADHLDVMGPTRLDVARALSATTPVGGVLFTAEDRSDSLSVLEASCEDRGTSLSVVDADDVLRVTQDELAGFSYLEHAENVALALKVCGELGVDRGVALAGMWDAQPDPGAMRVHTQAVRGEHWNFVNAFAANDPESTTRIWDAAYNYFPGTYRRVLVMNCRVDRMDRSDSMGEACATWPAADRYVIIGSGTDVFLRRLLKGGVDSGKILCLGDATGSEIIASLDESFRRIGDQVVNDPSMYAKASWNGGVSTHQESAALSPDASSHQAATLLMGIGNVAGPGMAFADFFAQPVGWEAFQSAVEPSRVLAKSV